MRQDRLMDQHRGIKAILAQMLLLGVYFTAEDIRDHEQLEEHAADQARQLGYIPTPQVVGRRGTVSFGRWTNSPLSAAAPVSCLQASCNSR